MSATPEQIDIDTLLDRLAGDDAFRDRMQNDPAGALAECGIKVDPSEIPDKRTLPSKEVIQAQRAEIKGKITDGAHLAIFIVIGQ